MFQPEGNSENENSAPWIRYAIVGVVAVALVACAYYFGEQYVTNEQIKQQELAQEKIKKNVQEATFDLGTFNTISIDANAHEGKASNAASTGSSPTGERYYSVIAGSFRSLENANKKVAALKAEGYDAALANQSPSGLYRVAFGRLPSKRKAMNLLSFVKYAQEEEAWYLEE